MSFTDMIKNKFLEGFTAADLTTTSIVAASAVAVVLGMYIYFIYRFSNKSGFYNRNFNKTLAVLPLITTGIVLAMQSNLVISLGMVGALSIIRFRNAVKDASDLMYLFWSISVGIIVGAGLYELVILLCLFITILIFGIDLLPTFRAPCILVVSGDSGELEPELLTVIREFAPRAKIRSRNISQRGAEWIFELQTKKEAELVSRTSAIAGVSSLNLMTHDGDVRF